MHTAGKEQETRGGRRGRRAARWVGGPRAAKKPQGRLAAPCPQPSWNHRTHWTSLELPRITGLLHGMCPQSHSLEQNEPLCGATCLRPPRECRDGSPCHPWAPRWGHYVLHVSGTDFCLAAPIHVPEAPAAQQEDAARGPGGRRQRCWSLGSRKTDKRRSAILICAFLNPICCQRLTKPDRHSRC